MHTSHKTITNTTGVVTTQDDISSSSSTVQEVLRGTDAGSADAFWEPQTPDRVRLSSSSVDVTLFPAQKRFSLLL